MAVEVIHELNKIKEIEQEINRDHLIYKTGGKKKSKTYEFQKFLEEKVTVALLH